MAKRAVIYGLALFFALGLFGTAAQGAEPAAKVYVILWFDTEDYLLPASDDAAKDVAEFLTKEGIRATFKVVGQKARTLVERKRQDVIDALKKHEIGYHSNYHSVQPSPAMYLSNLGWDEGVVEFDRREGPGRIDVERIFGVAPTCYGQPGSSWGPQSYGAMKKWGMPIYLDAGKHVSVEGRPHYYCGLFTLYNLTHTIRADINNPQKLPEAQDRFLAAHKALLAEGGGVVSIVYHPCEFVHKQFWDGVNFKHGANPPPSEWKRPPQKTPEETRISREIFANYIAFMKRFPEVRFITASEAGKLYRDKAEGRAFTMMEIKAIAAAVGDEVTFQKRDDITLSPAEIFALLNHVPFVDFLGIKKEASPLGPTGTIPILKEPISVKADQFLRTTGEVADYLKKHGRIPSAVWLGGQAVPPEAYLAACARLTHSLRPTLRFPETIEIRPTKLAVSRYVSDDDPKLWSWVIFPPGFRAPELMELARRQAWTLKPAVLHGEK